MLRWLTLPPDVDATAVELSLTRGRHWLSGAGEQTTAIPIPATVFSDRRDRQARQQSGEPGQAQGIPAFPRRGAACGASLQCPLITQSGHQSYCASQNQQFLRMGSTDLPSAALIS